MMQNVHRKIKCRTVMATAAFNKHKAVFTSKVYLHFRKKLVQLYMRMVLKLGQFRK